MATQLYGDKRSREKPCIRCGYSLRHINDARHCPECGLSIWISLSEHGSLDRINPAWFDRMARACIAMSVVQILALAGLVGWWFYHSRLFRNLPVFLPFIAIFLMASYLVIHAMSMWLLRADNNAMPEDIRAWRTLLILAAIASAIVGLSYSILSLRPLFLYLLRSPIYQNWEYVLGLGLITSSAATLAYMRQLAIVLRRRRAEHFCEALLLVPGLMLPFALPGIGPVFMRPLGVILRYVALAYFPASAVLLVWMTRAFRMAAKNARELWAAESAA